MIKQYEMMLDDSWVDELIQWANENDIPDLRYVEPDLDNDGSVLCKGYWLGLPRKKETLIKLETLNLNGFLKTDIPEQIRYLTKLKVLLLADGPKTEWSIEDIDQDNNAITEIPYWIEELENLEVLDLSFNNISYLPALSKLTKLKKLYLSYNRVMGVSKGLSKLKRLEVLHLFGSRSFITDSMRQLRNLKEFWLNGVVGSDYGPIKRSSEGLEWPTYDGRFFVYKNHKIRNCEDPSKKSLIEIIELMELWE